MKMPKLCVLLDAWSLVANGAQPSYRLAGPAGVMIPEVAHK